MWVLADRFPSTPMLITCSIRVSAIDFSSSFILRNLCAAMLPNPSHSSVWRCRAAVSDAIKMLVVLLIFLFLWLFEAGSVDAEALLTTVSAVS